MNIAKYTCVIFFFHFENKARAKYFLSLGRGVGGRGQTLGEEG